MASQITNLTIEKTSKVRITGLYAGNSTVTDEFPAQMASNPENVSIWWRHHEVDDFATHGLGRIGAKVQINIKTTSIGLDLAICNIALLFTKCLLSVFMYPL